MKQLLFFISLIVTQPTHLLSSGNEQTITTSSAKTNALKQAIEQNQLEQVRTLLAQQKLNPDEKQKMRGVASGQVKKYGREKISPTIWDTVRIAAGGVLAAFGCWALYRAYTTYMEIINAQKKLDTIPGLDDIEPETPIAKLKGTLTRQMSVLFRDIRINRVKKKKEEIKASMPKPLDYWLLAGTGIIASAVGIKNLYSGITCSDAKNRLLRAQEILKLIENN